MTYNVLMGTLNSTHSLTTSLIPRTLKELLGIFGARTFALPVTQSRQEKH